jgi:hypothetical protein
VHIVGNAATAPAASAPASRLVTTAAPTIAEAATHVSAVVDQRRGDPGRGRPAPMHRGANASTGIAQATASAAGMSATRSEQATYAAVPAATPVTRPRRISTPAKTTAKMTWAGTCVAALSAIVLAGRLPASMPTANTATAKAIGSAATHPAAEGPSRRSIRAAAAMTSGAMSMERKTML